MIVHEMASFNIISVWRNADFFYEKSQIMLSFNVQHIGTGINLPVSRAQNDCWPSRP
jgi:hypothetical protein